MIKYFGILIVFFCISFHTWGQDYYPDSLVKNWNAANDTLPIISHKKNIPLLILGIAYGAFYFGFNADEYQIKNKKTLNNKRLAPYFYAQNDPIVIESYNYHRRTRPIYLAGVPIGYSIFFVGLASSFAYAFSGARANTGKYTGPTLMAIGGGLMGISLGVRIKSFSKLKVARNRYNQLILERKLYQN
jgi:hypothetical protein